MKRAKGEPPMRTKQEAKPEVTMQAHRNSGLVREMITARQIEREPQPEGEMIKENQYMEVHKLKN